MNLSEMLSIATIYKFLSECFYYPDKDQIEIIKSFKGILTESCDTIIDKLDNVQTLQVEYSRLFVGPFEMFSPPYGSVYLEEGKKTYGNSTIDIIQIYQEEKLKVMMKEPPDHIAIELEFMHYLLSRECEAINDNDIRKLTLYRKKQSQFIKIHLSAWVTEFAESILNNTKSEFYNLLANELKDRINTDLIRIETY
jgi:TorA maturation chaperone TorD